MGRLCLIPQRGKLLQRLRQQPGSRKISTSPQASSKEKHRQKERQFFESVLSTSTTKRDLKSFLSRFNGSETPQTQPRIAEPKVNLGTPYSPYTALENSPLFTQDVKAIAPTLLDLKLHVSIVKIRDLEACPQPVLEGVAATLHQLARLGVVSLIVIDEDQSVQAIRAQCQRVAAAINAHHPPGARIIDQAFAVSTEDRLSLAMPQLVLSPLKRNIISILPPIAYSDLSHVRVVDANQIVLALTEAFRTRDTTPFLNTLLDRLIFLEDSGGLTDSKDGTHTQSFVNLQSEYAEIHSRLLSNLLGITWQSTGENHAEHHPEPRNSAGHLKTLECIGKCLAILPPSASALVTTANEVAQSCFQTPALATGVSTRPRRNPLIHNILTDKPMVSSSLPTGRLVQSTSASPSAQGGTSKSTLFKRGMPVKITPDPRFHPWTAPNPLTRSLRLDQSDIDFAKLKFLIEDSFNRRLDVDAYMQRVHQNLAGIVIAGDYEGGAIFTWEQPTNGQNRPPVPYLDKFAVLKRCQGAGGVADVVFNTMVRECFPNGVMWKSRNANPVNKWYFERASGTWQMPGIPWTIFWTGTGIGDAYGKPDALGERIEDYLNVCQHIQPSWADQKPPD